MPMRRAPFYNQYAEFLQNSYMQKHELLVDFTIPLTIQIADILGFAPQFIKSSDLHVQGEKTDRLISILKTIGADHYISGPSAQDYIDPQLFAKARITLEYMQYTYPEILPAFPPICKSGFHSGCIIHDRGRSQKLYPWKRQCLIFPISKV